MNLYLEAKKRNPLHVITSGTTCGVEDGLLKEEVQMELCGHYKQPKSWNKVDGKWIKVDKPDKHDDVVYTEKVKVYSLPNPKCSKCHGRGHKGYLSRKDNPGFVLCSCVMRPEL